MMLSINWYFMGKHDSLPRKRFIFYTAKGAFSCIIYMVYVCMLNLRIRDDCLTISRQAAVDWVRSWLGWWGILHADIPLGFATGQPMPSFGCVSPVLEEPTVGSARHAWLTDLWSPSIIFIMNGNSDRESVRWLQRAQQLQWNNTRLAMQLRCADVGVP